MTRSVIPLLVALALVGGCQAKPGGEIPDEPDSLTLFSIDGAGSWKGERTELTLYGCPVLGSVEITDPTQRRDVMAEVKNAIQNAPKDRAACWMPRHVLRLVTKGKALDVVICFECRSYRAYHSETESVRAGGGGISPDGQTMLNDILAKANVPVAPKLGQ